MSTYNIQMNMLNSSNSYDTLYPQTLASQVSGTLSTSQIPDLSSSYLPTSGGTLTGNLRLKNNSNYGMKLNFGDGDYVFLEETTDDNLTIKAKNIELTTTGSLTNNGNVIGGSNADSVKYIIGTRMPTGTNDYTITLDFTKLFFFAYSGKYGESYTDTYLMKNTTIYIDGKNYSQYFLWFVYPGLNSFHSILVDNNIIFIQSTFNNKTLFITSNATDTTMSKYIGNGLANGMAYIALGY